MKTILFHVGPHKTASTSLQDRFFTPNNLFLKPAGRAFPLRIFVDKFSTEPLSLDDKTTIKKFVDSAVTRGYTPVISHERLSGYPLSGGFDRFSIYSRISSLMPDYDVKVLYLMREQRSWLYSAWKQTIHDGGSISLKDFIGENRRVNVRVPRPRLRYVDYWLEIETLTRMFGKSNFLVFPFELLSTEFSIFLEELGTLIGRDLSASKDGALGLTNIGSSLSSLYFHKFVNRYLVSTVTSGGGGGLISEGSKIGKLIRMRVTQLGKTLPEFPFSSVVSEKQKEDIVQIVNDYFSESNRRVSNWLGYDLSVLGYDMGYRSDVN